MVEQSLKFVNEELKVMSFPPKLLLIFLIVGICASLGFAQGDPNPSGRTAIPIGHVSKGGFSILLPVDVTAQRQITPGQGTRGGMQYFWRTSDGEFFVSFYDNSEKSPDAKQELEAMSNNYLSGVTKNGGKLLEKKEITLETKTGLQIKASLKSSETVIIRYFLVERRVFILSTRWNPKETGEKQLKVLDSFRLVSNK
jgi:hypothetical protein